VVQLVSPVQFWSGDFDIVRPNQPTGRSPGSGVVW
jgi:hypothetical protein